MLLQIQPGQILENKKTKCKYRVIGMDMGFIALHRVEDQIAANVFKFPVPYVRYNYEQVEG